MLNDADIEMRELEASAEHDAGLRRLGVCVHGWTQGGVDTAGNPHSGDCVKCLDCGRVYASLGDMEHARAMAKIEGVIVDPIAVLPVPA